MPVFKCKMCGGTIKCPDGATTAECEYCLSTQTLPHLSDEKTERLYDRANHFRRNNEFDKAMAIYEQILDENNEDSEAYWSIVLCRYGIEYVTDPQTNRKVPTVNRTQYTSIYDDDNYVSALKYADISQKCIYEREAREINELQKGILEISQNEEPFDVFICYKETDENGNRTHDSVYANELYHVLTGEDFKVFFSRITLEDKLGTEYEPYIFAALNSAKAMVVLGTKKEYFEAPWVKNEWSRYLTLVKASKGKKILIPAYKDMDPYDMPEEFSHLQAQNMNNLGFTTDIVRGIKKIIGTQNASVAEPAKINLNERGNANTDALLKRAELFLSSGEWSSADAYCEKVLDTDPENSWAYMYKLCAELRVEYRDLSNCKVPLDSARSYKNAIRFADNATIEHITTLNRRIKENIQRSEARQKKYGELVDLKNRTENNIRSIEDRIQRAKSLQSQREYDISIAVQKAAKTKRLATSFLIILLLTIASLVSAIAMMITAPDDDTTAILGGLLIMVYAILLFVNFIVGILLLRSDGKSVGIIIVNFLFAYNIIALVTAFKSFSKYSKRNMAIYSQNQLYSLNDTILSSESELEKERRRLEQYNREIYNFR